MSELVVRPSRPGDEPGLKALWQLVFQDESPLIDAFFRILYAPGMAVAAAEDGRILSAGYCVPGAMAGPLRCSYIYAVATDPGARGRGLAAQVCRELTRRAFANGADVVATLPASESLCGWYERILDMAPAFRRGGSGVTFPPDWHAFAAVCGAPEDDGAPDFLRAVRADGADVEPLQALGWALCFD